MKWADLMSRAKRTADIMRRGFNGGPNLIGIRIFRSPASYLPAALILISFMSLKSETRGDEPTLIQPATSETKFAAETLDVLHQPLLHRDGLSRTERSLSCSAANCHGGPQPGITNHAAVRGSEYQVWFEDDPHALSWRTLCSKQSEAILERLEILKDGLIADPAAFNNCLACHNTSQLTPAGGGKAATNAHSSSPGQIPHDFNREGVGCASCHGPSFQWKESHYRFSWESQSVTQKTESGFVSLEDVLTRARVCASCHIGDRDRDMNHDIIAAGHPPLRYEFATYHAKLPKHWRDHEAMDESTFEPRLWVAGQIAAVDAFLSLLESRASKATLVSQWPEFAAYDCASCHHEFGLKNRRPVNRNGIPSYSRWHDVGLQWLLKNHESSRTAQGTTTDIINDLRVVSNLMESAIVPDRDAVASAAQRARKSLALWVSKEGLHVQRTIDRHSLRNVIGAASQQADTFSYVGIIGSILSCCCCSRSTSVQWRNIRAWLGAETAVCSSIRITVSSVAKY